MNDRTIMHLTAAIAALPGDQRRIFEQIYDYYQEIGCQQLPPPMQEWAPARFGEVEKQQITRITNRWTYESTLFNRLRGRRPVQVVHLESMQKIIDEGCSGGPFSTPLEQTPCDLFGRIEGKYCITAANIAKYDYLHGMIIFQDPNPFVHDPEKIADFLDVAERWCAAAHSTHHEAIYPFFLWNCLWRAGASMIHGHAQVLLSHAPYAGWAWLHRVRGEYRARYGSDYFEDLFSVHQALGLGFEAQGATGIAHLTPRKEDEVLILARKVTDLAAGIGHVLAMYQQQGIQCYNVGVLMNPLGSDEPVLARIVNRGDPASTTSDFGGMEVFGGTSVISADPFVLAAHLQQHLGPGGTEKVE
jgi:hypothetical protein